MDTQYTVSVYRLSVNSQRGQKISWIIHSNKHSSLPYSARRSQIRTSAGRYQDSGCQLRRCEHASRYSLLSHSTPPVRGEAVYASGYSPEPCASSAARLLFPQADNDAPVTRERISARIFAALPGYRRAKYGSLPQLAGDLSCLRICEDASGYSLPVTGEAVRARRCLNWRANSGSPLHS